MRVDAFVKEYGAIIATVSNDEKCVSLWINAFEQYVLVTRIATPTLRPREKFIGIMNTFF